MTYSITVNEYELNKVALLCYHMYVLCTVEWNPYNADALQNKKSVLIVRVSKV